MTGRLLGLALWTALVGAGCVTGRRGAVASVAPAPRRLLFIGNSFTFYNGGIDQQVRLLAASAHPPRLLDVDRATKGGATLRILHGLGWVHEKIQEGHPDLVILQDDIPELKEHDVAPFREHVRLFDAEIRRAGARSVLFMAWPYERLGWATWEQIEAAHREVGRELGIPVAPVGRALRRALEARPRLAMLGADKEHETLHGTYLAAVVIHAVAFGADPRGLTYRPEGVTEDEAAFLRDIAWRTVREWASEGKGKG